MNAASFVIAAGREIDGAPMGEGLEETRAAWSALERRGARIINLVIDPLAAGWNTPIEPNHFRSGCGPIEAIARADTLIRSGAADAVMISGEDRIRTGYAKSKAERQRLMDIYGAECPIPQAYTLLAHAFMRRHGIDAERFRGLAHALFDNYTRTLMKRGTHQPPKPDSFRFVTDLFRLVDCANPVIDFAGAVVLGKSDFAPAKARVALVGVGLGETASDGPQHVETIASYDHLIAACRGASAQSRIDFAGAFLAREAILEAYTCFPVAPLGFLLASGIARTIDSIDEVLASHEITVTGGMNLARAPWNNPALNATIALIERLRAGDAPLAVVHGNGGLGYKQGVAMFGVAR